EMTSGVTPAFPPVEQPGVVHTTSADHALFDRGALLERVEQDLYFLREMVEVFQATSPRHVEEIREALIWKDEARLIRAAHTFRGAAATFAAGDLIRRLRELEEVTR